MSLSSGHTMLFVGSSAYLRIDCSNGLILDGHSVLSGHTLPRRNLFVHPGGSGYTLLADYADLIGEASRRRRSSASGCPWLAPPTLCPQPDPAIESAGSPPVPSPRGTTASGTGSRYSKFSAYSSRRGICQT
uniref:Uncharacterized protein n=1 Tax=Triticum urartu TaxID=4572 RepID=A0A8R7PY13_TRIUA